MRPRRRFELTFRKLTEAIRRLFGLKVGSSLEFDWRRGQVLLTRHQKIFALLRSIQLAFAAGGLGLFVALFSQPTPHAVSKAPVIAIFGTDPRTLVECGGVFIGIALALEPIVRVLRRRWRGEIEGWFA